MYFIIINLYDIDYKHNLLQIRQIADDRNTKNCMGNWS